MNKYKHANTSKANNEPSKLAMAEDRLARFTFSDPSKAAGLFREFLPADLVSCLDLDALVCIKEQQIHHNLRERRDDLNFECPILYTEDPAPDCQLNLSIRILVEHKSAYDPELWFQLMDSILTKWTKDGFAPILTIVLHTGPDPFRLESPKNKLREQETPEVLLDFVPELPVQAIDLSKSTVDTIAASNHLDTEAKVILSIMQLVQSKNVSVASIRSLFRKYYASEPTDVQKQYLEAALNYIKFKVPLLKDDVETMRIAMALAHPIHPDSVFAQELRESHAEGIAEGKAKVVQNMLAEGLTWELIQKVTGIREEDWSAGL